jgi:hypothetical protein
MIARIFFIVLFLSMKIYVSEHNHNNEHFA